MVTRWRSEFGEFEGRAIQVGCAIEAPRFCPAIVGKGESRVTFVQPQEEEFQINSFLQADSCNEICLL